MVDDRGPRGFLTVRRAASEGDLVIVEGRCPRCGGELRQLRPSPLMDPLGWCGVCREGWAFEGTRDGATVSRTFEFKGALRVVMDRRRSNA